MAHTRSVSAPTPSLTPRGAKRHGMLFTRPFTWTEYAALDSPASQVSTLPSDGESDYWRQEASWGAARSSPSDYSKQEASWRAARASESDDAYSKSDGPALPAYASTSMSASRVSIASTASSDAPLIKAHQARRHQPTKALSQRHQSKVQLTATCPAKAFLASCKPCPDPWMLLPPSQDTDPLSHTEAHSRTSSSSGSAYSTPRSTSSSACTSTLSLTSTPSSTPPRRFSPLPFTLTPPNLTDLDLVARTPFLELAMSPKLAIRPVLPCERCALHAQECRYDPPTLIPAWEGDTLALPKCACCPDEEGCWHVLRGRMVRPSAVVFDSPCNVGLEKALHE